MSLSSNAVLKYALFIFYYSLSLNYTKILFKCNQISRWDCGGGKNVLFEFLRRDTGRVCTVV